MKNVIIGAFMLACTLTATAQTDINTQKTQQATTTAQPASTTATAQPKQEQDGYNKVTQNEIAPAVLNKAVEKYEGYELVEALVAKDGTNYKLVLTKDGKDIAAYYKNNGEFIKEETV
jgi:hypothetical protein